MLPSCVSCVVVGCSIVGSLFAVHCMDEKDEKGADMEFYYPEQKIVTVAAHSVRSQPRFARPPINTGHLAVQARHIESNDDF